MRVLKNVDHITFAGKAIATKRIIDQSNMNLIEPLKRRKTAGGNFTSLDHKNHVSCMFDSVRKKIVALCKNAHAAVRKSN